MNKDDYLEQKYHDLKLKLAETGVEISFLTHFKVEYIIRPIRDLVRIDESLQEQYASEKVHLFYLNELAEEEKSHTYFMEYDGPVMFAIGEDQMPPPLIVVHDKLF